MRHPKLSFGAFAFAMPVLFSFAVPVDRAFGFTGNCASVSRIEDFSKFQLCFGFPDAAPPGVNCAGFDFDANGVVNKKDFSESSFVLRLRLLVSPARAILTYSETLDFNATVVGPGNPAVSWTVAALPGSEPGETLGTIDANGLYSPPSPLDLHAASQVLISASSGPESKSACVSLFGTLTGSPPISSVLPGPGVSVGLPVNVTIASPQASLVLPGPGDTDTLPPNVTVAGPPVTVEFQNP